MSHLKSVHGRQCQRNGSTCFRSRGERSEVQGLRIYGCHWERARREGEFENAVKGENCSCMIPAGGRTGGVDGNWSFGGRTFSTFSDTSFSWFLCFSHEPFDLRVLSFSLWNRCSRTLPVAMLLACSGRSGAW